MHCCALAVCCCAVWLFVSPCAPLSAPHSAVPSLARARPGSVPPICCGSCPPTPAPAVSGTPKGLWVPGFNICLPGFGDAEGRQRRVGGKEGAHSGRRWRAQKMVAGHGVGVGRAAVGSAWGEGSVPVTHAQGNSSQLGLSPGSRIPASPSSSVRRGWELGPAGSGAVLRMPLLPSELCHPLCPPPYKAVAEPALRCSPGSGVSHAALMAQVAFPGATWHGGEASVPPRRADAEG